MLPLTLNTNEIKIAAGTEIEYVHLNYGTGREHFYHQINESSSLLRRLSIKHTEAGVGLKRRRRSVVRFDDYVVADLDASLIVPASFYQVADLPVGAMSTNSGLVFSNVIAKGMSFLASLGASTTILYDCTGNGAQVLLNGEL